MQVQFPEAARVIIQNLEDMDDCITSVDSVEKAARLAADIVEVHQKAGFEMRNWVSNETKALALLPEDLLLAQASNIHSIHSIPYVYNFEIYVGAQPEGPFQKSNKVNDVVHRVLDPLYDLGCNVTMDNYFTNLPLAKELLQKKITIVGTMKANRPEIPKEFKASKSRTSKSSVFGFQKDVTLVSYVPKRNKAVTLLSTMHYDAAIDPDTKEDRNPEIVTFYNRTKCGVVNILDKMCKQYSVLRNSRRWPLTFFF